MTISSSQSPLRTVSLLLVALAWALIALGCGPSDQAAAFSHELRAASEYYEGGPQQARPPDGTWPAGTKVKIVEEAGSYTLVESESGETAFVSAGALRKQRE